MDDIIVPGCKLGGCLNKIGYMADGETKCLVKKDVIFDWFVSFCMSLYTSMCGATTAAILYLNCMLLSMKQSTLLKWSAKPSAVWRPFFRVLVFSEGFFTVLSVSSSFCSLSLASCSWCSSVTQCVRIIAVNQNYFFKIMLCGFNVTYFISCTGSHHYAPCVWAKVYW